MDQLTKSISTKLSFKSRYRLSVLENDNADFKNINGNIQLLETNQNIIKAENNTQTNRLNTIDATIVNHKNNLDTYNPNKSNKSEKLALKKTIKFKEIINYCRLLKRHRFSTLNLLIIIEKLEQIM